MHGQTRYARNGGVHLAYQVRGAGATDILLIPDWLTHIDVITELPDVARGVDRFAGLGRLIMTNIRGVGASDPVDHAQTRREDWRCARAPFSSRSSGIQIRISSPRVTWSVPT
jgi:hypothetical protein